MRDIDIIDLFDEEQKKKEVKHNRRIEKQKEKEKKKNSKELKRLEKKEDLEFENYLKQMQKKEENPVTKVVFEEKKESHPVLNFFLVLFVIGLIVVTADYVLYNTIINYKSFEIMINSIALAIVVFFYLLSIAIKKISVKKFFEILSIISMIGFMLMHLFVV